MNRKKIALPVANGYEFTAIASIIRCQASGNYTTFYLDNGKSIMVSKNLGLFDDLLSRHNFLRIHRAHLINLAHLTGYIRGKGGYAIMADGAELEISCQKKPTFLAALPLYSYVSETRMRA